MLSEQEQKIWINVTTSTSWARPAVGIVRVENELKNRLKQLYPKGEFRECIWNGDAFVEYAGNDNSLDYASNTAQKEQGKTYTPTYVLPVLSKRKALFSIAQGVLSLAPSRSRPFLYRGMRKCNFMLHRYKSYFSNLKVKYKGIRNCVFNKKKSIRHKGNNNYQHPFERGDILISVGLDWGYSFYKGFYHLRTRDEVKIVTCCYDLIPVIYPQYCVGEVASQFSSYFLDVAEGSDLVLCISRQSERDLKSLLDKTGGRDVRTHVIALGNNIPEAAESGTSEEIENIISEPYILFVSSIERRKNHEVLYRAYHLLCKEGRYNELPKLVFVGMTGWGVDDLLKDIELDPLTRGLIIQLNRVSDAELLTLYKEALFCVYPSLYEGWGLPVGEALSLGKVVVCSNKGSLPEVGGDLVLYADPWKPNQWAEIILKLIQDENYRNDLENHIETNYRPKVWEDTAFSVYQAIGVFS